MFGILAPTYGAIIQKFMSNQEGYTSGKSRGNYTAKDARIPSTKALEVKVRDWVRDRRSRRQRATGRQVLDYLVEEKILVLERDNSGTYTAKALATGWRNVRNWLSKMGYRRGKKIGNLVPSQEHTLKRHLYFNKFF